MRSRSRLDRMTRARPARAPWHRRAPAVGELRQLAGELSLLVDDDDLAPVESAALRHLDPAGQHDDEAGATCPPARCARPPHRISHRRSGAGGRSRPAQGRKHLLAPSVERRMKGLGHGHPQYQTDAIAADFFAGGRYRHVRRHGGGHHRRFAENSFDATWRAAPNKRRRTAARRERWQHRSSRPNISTYVRSTRLALEEKRSPTSCPSGDDAGSAQEGAFLSATRSAGCGLRARRADALRDAAIIRTSTPPSPGRGLQPTDAKRLRAWISDRHRDFPMPISCSWQLVWQRIVTPMVGGTPGRSSIKGGRAADGLCLASSSGSRRRDLVGGER